MDNDHIMIDTYDLNAHEVVALLEEAVDSRESFTVITCNNSVATYHPAQLNV